MNLTDLDNGSVTCDDDPGEPTTGERRVSITAKEGALLRSLARGRCVIEIGTGLGVSTTFLASTAELVITHDIDPWVHEHVWPWLREDYDNIVCTAERNVTLVGARWAYDMAFIDGEHTVDALRADLAYVEGVIKQGVVVVHDTTTVGELRDALDDTWAYVDTTHGLGVKFVGYR